MLNEISGLQATRQPHFQQRLGRGRCRPEALLRIQRKQFAVESLLMAVAAKVERLGIKMTIVESSFFRKSLLNPQIVQIVESKIDDYANNSSVAKRGPPRMAPSIAIPQTGAGVSLNCGDGTSAQALRPGRDAVKVTRPVAEERFQGDQ